MECIANLTFVRKSKNAFRNRDGLYKKGNDYYLTCVHGESNGKLDIQFNDKHYKVVPSTFRKLILQLFNEVVTEENNIYICPCNTSAVLSRYQKGFIKNGIKIMPGSDQKNTYFYAVEGNQKKFHLVVGNSEELIRTPYFELARITNEAIKNENTG